MRRSPPHGVYARDGQHDARFTPPHIRGPVTGRGGCGRSAMIRRRGPIRLDNRNYQILDFTPGRLSRRRSAGT